MSELHDTLPIGTILQGEHYQYKIIEVLGQGSFGITYKAELILQGGLGSLRAKTLVAIKEFFMNGVNGREEQSNSISVGSTEGMFGDYMRKFRREAKNLGKLDHPNIIQVLEIFDANNTAYYVMEFVAGGSVEDRLKREHHLSEQEAVKYISSIGSALELMHSKSMLHLDLKPGNIMLKDNDTPVLIDFGLSKHFDEHGMAESSTKIGGGTPGYSPLEQATYDKSQGVPVTMDVYALGATLYKLLTGVRPPEASSIFNDGFPSNVLREAGVSEHTIACIDKAMAPKKALRYQSVNEFVEDLNDFDADVEGGLIVEPEDDDELQPVENNSANPPAVTPPLPGANDGERTVVGNAPQAVADDEHTALANDYVNSEKTEILTSDDVAYIEEPEQKSNNKKYIFIFLGCALVAAIVCLIAFNFMGNGDGESDVADSTAVVEEAPTVSDLQLSNAIGSFTYSGEVNDAGQPNGKGVAKYSNGNVYDGEWVSGKQTGECVYTLKNGDTFTGKFKNDFYDEGKYVIKATGEYFEGTYKNGNPDKGSWYDKNGKKIQ